MAQNALKKKMPWHLQHMTSSSTRKNQITRRRSERDREKEWRKVERVELRMGVSRVTTQQCRDMRDKDQATNYRIKDKVINMLRELLRGNKLFGESELIIFQAWQGLLAVWIWSLHNPCVFLNLHYHFYRLLVCRLVTCFKCNILDTENVAYQHSGWES